MLLKSTKTKRKKNDNHTAYVQLFRTTHTAKIQQVVRSRGQHCGDVELVGYLANAAGPVPLVLDLCIVHDRFGSSSDPTLNGRLHYNDIDKSLNETVDDKIRKYHTDYNNNPPNTVAFMPGMTGTNGRLHSDLSDFYSYRLIGKLTAFCSFRSSVSAIKLWSHVLSLSSRGCPESA